MKKIELGYKYSRDLLGNVKLFIIKNIIENKKIFPYESIMIFGDPRGGTTWLMEILNKIPNTSIIWEPFHKNNGVVPEHFNFGWHPYLTENVSSEELRDFFIKLLSGQILNVWTTRMSSLNDYFNTKKFIIKSVRITTLLPWLVKNIQFKYKPIYLIRHPIPTAVSQLRAFNYDYLYDTFSLPQVAYNERFIPHLNLLKELNTPFEKAITQWCLHNIEVINHKGFGNDWIVVYYENLLLDPAVEISRIFDQLNIEVPEGIFHDIRKPSSTVFANDFYPDAIKQLMKWESRISEKEKDKAQKILTHFGIKIYNSNQATPMV